MFEGFSDKTLSVDGTDIACVIAGAGPPVLLLHGFPQNKAMWARVAPLLAEQFTVVCADLRGYGASAKPQPLPDYSNYSFRALASDQVGLMRQLGHQQFHLVGHDRGARTAHRAALDHPEALLSLSLMDIVPTYTMFMATNRHVASVYWHWYFLSQPAPFPETLIGHDPDYVFEACLLGWGGSTLKDFDPDMLAAYQAAWRDPDVIRAMCADYRAAATIDLQHDTEDLGRKIACPTLVLHGEKGAMAQHFDIPGQWRERCETMTHASLPGGHFFVDQLPRETADLLKAHLNSVV